VGVKEFADFLNKVEGSRAGAQIHVL